MLLYNSIRGFGSLSQGFQAKKLEFDRLVLSPPPSPSIGVGIWKVLTNPMQSQVKTFQPQLKALRKKGKKYSWSQKGCFLLQVLIPIFNCKCKDLQGGTLCGPVFCNCFKGFNKENSFLNKVKFCLQSQLKTIQPQLKTLRKKGRKYS